MFMWSFLKNFFLIIFLSGCRHGSWFMRIPGRVCACTEKNIVVVIPSYQNRAWCVYTMRSLRLQQYRSFRVIYIDDCSSDGTADAVEHYCTRYHMKNVRIVRNKQRVGALANIYHACAQCADDEIVVFLDGDDWFAHNRVLAYINEVYQDTQVWATYGQFCNWPTGTCGWGKAIPADIVVKNKWRSYGFWFVQPRTCYAWLAKQVRYEDLIDVRTGKFFTVAGDVAFMLPIVEMAGKHVRFINKVLYYRNVKTPLNDFKCRQSEQEKVTRMLLAQKPYKPRT